MSIAGCGIGGVVYMGNAVGGSPAETVGWTQLPRNSQHRTSQITDQAVRRAVGAVALARGRKPYADTVILAGLKLLERASDQALIELVEGIEQDRYTTRPHPGDSEPGE
jgi:hypothetical protein